MAIAAVYLALVGISALVLTDKRWAWWVVLILVLFLLSVGNLWYFPVVALTRMEAAAMGPAGWLQGSTHLGLFFVAGFICVLNLLGARLVPGNG